MGVLPPIVTVTASTDERPLSAVMTSSPVAVPSGTLTVMLVSDQAVTNAVTSTLPIFTEPGPLAAWVPNP